MSGTVSIRIRTDESGDEITYPKNGDRVTVNYTGSLAKDGRVIDNSYENNKNVFVLENFTGVQGLKHGIGNMSLGEISRVSIPSKLGFGSEGVGGLIPENADLEYRVHLPSFLSVVDATRFVRAIRE